MRVHATKLYRGLLLLFLCIFIIRLIKSGEIYLLVSPLIENIIKCTIGPLVLLALAMFKYSFSFHQEHSHSHNHEHGDSCNCGHDHSKPNSFWGKMTVGLLITSLVIAYSWQPKQFGTDMIANAATQTVSHNNTVSSNNPSSDHTPNAPGIINVNEDIVGITKQKNGDSESSIAMHYADDPKNYWGKVVNLDGFVFHPPGLPKNYFIITRFFIFCCVADACPIGIAVASNAGNNLKNDIWVHVTGVIEPQQLPILDKFEPTNWYPNDSKKPVIIAKALKLIPTPDKPYMIPY